jgi:hypothetical protein
MEWLLALCIAPIGMWLGWLGGASGNRRVAGAALGGTIGATLAAVAYPILFNWEGPSLNNYFWILDGLFIGGFVGSLVGAWTERRSEEQLGHCWQRLRSRICLTGRCAR